MRKCLCGDLAANQSQPTTFFFFFLWKIEKDSVNAMWEETQVPIGTKTELPNGMKLVFLYLPKVCHQMLLCVHKISSKKIFMN